MLTWGFGVLGFWGFGLLPLLDPEGSGAEGGWAGTAGPVRGIFGGTCRRKCGRREN